MNHAITVGGLLLTLAAIVCALGALFGLMQWLSASLWPSGDDDSVGPRGLRLFIVAGISCAICIWGLL